MFKNYSYYYYVMEEINCLKCLKLVPFTNFCQNCGTKLPKISNCPICLEDKPLKIIICGHGVCLDCYKITYKTNKSCPLCRKPMEEDYESMEEYDSVDETNTVIDTCTNDKYTDETLNVCCECFSKDVENLNTESVKIYYCHNCEKTVENTLQIFKEDYDYKIYKVKNKKPFNKIKICCNCNSKDLMLTLNMFDSLQCQCLNCKKINPGSRDIFKYEYNIGINKVEFYNTLI